MSHISVEIKTNEKEIHFCVIGRGDIRPNFARKTINDMTHKPRITPTVFRIVEQPKTIRNIQA